MSGKSLAVIVATGFALIFGAQASAGAAKLGDSRTQACAAPVTPAPLTVEALPDLQAPGIQRKIFLIAKGAPYWVQWDVRNVGEAAAGSSHAKAYLTTDYDWDTSNDYALGELSVPALGVDSDAFIMWEFTMPDLGPGNYNIRFLCEVDSQAEVAESNEGNNLWRSTSDTGVVDNVRVTYPSDDGITLERGGTYVIQWEIPAGLGPKDLVNIELIGPANVSSHMPNAPALESWVLGAAIPNTGSFRWTVGKWKSKTQAPYADGANYKIRLSAGQGVYSDDSDFEFAIGTPTGLAISGGSSVDENSTSPYTCSAQYNFGADRDVTTLAKWQALSPNPKDPARFQSCKYAVMLPGGMLNTKSVAADQVCRITASYGKGKAALSASQDITILNDGP